MSEDGHTLPLRSVFGVVTVTRIVMRREALRTQAAARAATGPTGLSARAGAGRKRMAEVVAVSDVAPVVRTLKADGDFETCWNRHLQQELHRNHLSHYHEFDLAV